MKNGIVPVRIWSFSKIRYVAKTETLPHQGGDKRLGNPFDFMKGVPL